MFSYRIKVRKINSAKLKGVASLVIDDVIEIDGFKIIDGSKGLFVSVPSHKGTIMEDGVKVEKYFDDVRFPGEQAQEVGNEIKQAILAEYNSASDPLASNASQSNAVKAKQTAASNATSSSKDSSPPRDRKPLWGF
jgi:DNA-binding cell septation regulator SpoVG